MALILSLLAGLSKGWGLARTMAGWFGVSPLTLAAIAIGIPLAASLYFGHGLAQHHQGYREGYSAAKMDAARESAKQVALARQDAAEANAAAQKEQADVIARLERDNQSLAIKAAANASEAGRDPGGARIALPPASVRRGNDLRVRPAGPGRAKPISYP
jgi:hypothetical protein